MLTAQRPPMACTAGMAAVTSPHTAATRPAAPAPSDVAPMTRANISRRFVCKKSKYSSGASEKEKGESRFHFSAAAQPQRFRYPLAPKPSALLARRARTT
eukprot:TRINITY_DN21753_c0_g1_i1.p3 TRINITY_DN21753_c0_g1~~TRINITY_DN21753_c0_g1_i1.p3  ORF type:complete len:100 (+),score=17.33 TRINITY_DN21753_c0_g1_i1:209-508(+)